VASVGLVPNKRSNSGTGRIVKSYDEEPEHIADYAANTVCRIDGLKLISEAEDSYPIVHMTEISQECSLISSRPT
jgi:hypothetical protein